MKIYKIIAKSRTAEVATVAKQILTTFASTSLQEDAHISGIMGKLTSLADELIGAINNLKPESTLEERDGVRDDTVRAFYYLTYGLTYHPTAKISESAKEVVELFNKYGLGMVSESYAVESSLINSLLEDLEEKKETLDKVMGATQLVEKIALAQKKFEEAVLIYTQDKASEKEQRSATTIKKEVVALINEKLLPYLEVMVMVNGDGYEPFAGTVATLIDESNGGVKKRSKE